MDGMRTDMRKVLGMIPSLAALAAGAVLIFAVPSLRAAQTDGLVLRVTPADAQAPDVITDLLAAANAAADGEVILTWTAPADNPSGNAAAYELRYATFTVADVGGSTTTWWSLATPFAGVPAPPQAAGGFEAATVGGLPAVPHTFAVRSRDAANNWSAPGFSNAATPRGSRPAPVAGLLSIRLPDTSVTLNWNPVEMNENGGAVLVNDYIVRRSTSLTGLFNVTVSSGVGGSGPSSFFVSLSTAPSAVEYLMVVAADVNGNESDPALSNILEGTPRGIIGQIALARDGTVSRAYIPASAMGELRSSNGEGDRLIRVTPNTDPNAQRDPRTLATYDVGFVSPAQVVDKNFTLSKPVMNVVMQSPSALTGKDVAVLWWNGVSWVKVGKADVNDMNDTVSFYTALPGRYQIRSIRAATELALDKASVFPRIFTPNGDGINDEVLFVIDNPNGAAVDGKIYDVGGNEVAILKRAGAGAPTADTLSWNGRDRNGSLVPAGVYVYRVKGEGKSMTGTVVVAK